MIETGQGIEMDLSLKTDQIMISEAVDKFFRKWKDVLGMHEVSVTVNDLGESVVDYYTGDRGDAR